MNIKHLIDINKSIKSLLNNTIYLKSNIGSVRNELMKMVSYHNKQINKLNIQFNINISPVKTSAELYLRYIMNCLRHNSEIEQTSLQRYAIKNSIELDLMKSYHEEAVYHWKCETYDAILTNET
jgi:hypothetical protein